MRESIDPSKEAELARLGNALLSKTLAKKKGLKVKGTKSKAPKMNKTKKREKKAKPDIQQMSYTHPSPPKFSKLLSNASEQFKGNNNTFKKLKRQTGPKLPTPPKRPTPEPTPIESSEAQETQIIHQSRLRKHQSNHPKHKRFESEEEVVLYDDDERTDLSDV